MCHGRDGMRKAIAACIDERGVASRTDNPYDWTDRVQQGSSDLKTFTLIYTGAIDGWEP